MENVLDMDALPDLVVNAAYSPELGELKDEMDEIKAGVEELHEEARGGWCSFGEKARTSTFCRMLQWEGASPDLHVMQQLL